MSEDAIHPEAGLPPLGQFAKVCVDIALDDARVADGAPYPPGVFISRPDCLIVSHGVHATVLHFATPDDAARLALALLTLASGMQEDAHRASTAAPAACREGRRASQRRACPRGRKRDRRPRAGRPILKPERGY